MRKRSPTAADAAFRRVAFPEQFTSAYAFRINDSRFTIHGLLELMTRAHRILVVEDQYFVAADAELSLCSAGFDCVGLATTAADAVNLAECERPDLILMDIHLAGAGDGVDAAILIHERLGIRCIFSSAHADTKVRQNAQRACPLGWLAKPYSSAALVEAVREGLAEVDAEPQAAALRPVQSVLH